MVDSSAPHCLPPSSPAEAQAPPLPGILGWKMWLTQPFSSSLSVTQDMLFVVRKDISDMFQLCCLRMWGQDS